MAKVILGGLLTSTFLNGFIIPIVYSSLTPDPSPEERGEVNHYEIQTNNQV